MTKKASPKKAEKVSAKKKVLTSIPKSAQKTSLEKPLKRSTIKYLRDNFSDVLKELAKR